MSFVLTDPPLDAAPRMDAAWLDAYWMPYTANRQFKANPRMIVEAQGAYYTDSEGRKIFDGLSGLWCAGLGHGRREIAEAVGKQAARLDYSPAFQFGHPLAFELANRIKDLTPEGLDYVFFTGSGSEAADTSLKMARAYWRAKGQASKTRLIGREKGYHGVNYGGISVGGIGANRKMFGQGIEADHLPHTQPPAGSFHKGMPPTGKELADRLLDLIALHDASNIAAVFVEPMAGSAGVLVPPQGYLKRLREICDQHQNRAAEQSQHRRDDDELWHEGKRLLVDRGRRLHHADDQARQQHRDQDRRRCECQHPHRLVGDGQDAPTAWPRPLLLSDIHDVDGLHGLACDRGIERCFT